MHHRLHVAALLFIIVGLLFAIPTLSHAAQDRRSVPANPVTPNADLANKDAADAIIASLYKKIPRTHIETGFLNEINDEGFTHWTLYQPGPLNFRWNSEWSNAADGTWRLRMKTRMGNAVIATGKIGGAPPSIFSIPLQDYLPDTPPSKPRIYFVDIIAHSAAATGPTLSAGATGEKIPAADLGFHSTPVIISYGKNPNPQTQFKPMDRYKKVDLVLDEFIVVKDQTEIGNEEYLIAGFVQELFRPCHQEDNSACGFTIPGRQKSFGVIEKKMTSKNRDGMPFIKFTQNANGVPDIEQYRWTFPAGQNSGYPLARRIMLTASVLEDDAGGEETDWLGAINAFEDSIYTDKILEMSEDALEDYLEDHAFQAINIISDAITTIVSAVSSTTASYLPVIGMAVFLAGFYVNAAINAMADDYCQMHAAYIELPTMNMVEIHELPGRTETINDGPGYVTEKQEMVFNCPPDPLSATTAPGGVSKITFHWEFHDRSSQ